MHRLSAFVDREWEEVSKLGSRGVFSNPDSENLHAKLKLFFPKVKRAMSFQII